MAGKVLGIGGVFMRSKDPAALSAWYRDNLGFTATEAGQPDPDGNYTWLAEGGHTVISVFASDGDYWPTDRQVMLNLRVEDLDDLVAGLEKSGVTISNREEMDGVGRFARLNDLDGNPVELWEPDAATQ